MIVRLTGFLLSLALSSCGFGHLIQGMGVSTVKKSGSSKTEPVAAAADSTEEEEKKTISSETQKCRKFAGLFDVYQDTTDGSIKLAVRKEQIDKEYLYCTQTVDAPPITGHFRGSFRDNRVFSVRKYFNRIEFVSENAAYYFEKSHPLSNAAEANISDATLVSKEILVDDADAGTYLVDGKFFLTEAIHQVKASKDPNAKGPRFSLGSLSKEKTKVRGIYNYPANTDLVIEYVYDSAAPTVRGGSRCH